MSALSVSEAYSPNIEDEIEEELSAAMRRRTRQAHAYGQHFVALWNHASASLLGGKLLRPALLVRVFDGLTDGRHNPPVNNPAAQNPAVQNPHVPRAAVIRVAALVEMLHYSFLLHDDVIDGDLVRRHHPNLIGRMLDEQRTEPHHPSGAHPVDLRHWANTGGILMGDLMLAAVHQGIAREPLPQDVRIRLLDLLDHAITESVAGQQVDVGLGDGVITAELDDLLRVSRLKTGTYTFELPLRAAAILAGSPPPVEAALGDVAGHLGLAFQLQDDLLSTFSSAEEHGKDSFSDLREGKQTAIIAYARRTSAWPRIEPLLGAPDFDDSHGYALRELLTSCGAEDFVRSLVDQQIHACMELLALNNASVPPLVSHILADLMTSLEDRRA